MECTLGLRLGIETRQGIYILIFIEFKEHLRGI